jgi:Bacterial regulatory proteins, luxR family
VTETTRSSPPVPASTATWPAAVIGSPATERELGRLAAHLTQREIHVLAALCEPVPSLQAPPAAPTVRQIAAGLTVAEATVRQHLRRLYRKLDVPPGPGRRARLVRKAVALGLPLPGTQPEDQHSRKTACTTPSTTRRPRSQP